MVVTSKTSDYVDVDIGSIELLPAAEGAAISTMERRFKAAARSSKHNSYNVNKLDTPFTQEGSASDSWGAVYSHAYETIGFEAVESGDVASRQTASDQGLAAAADIVKAAPTSRA